MPNIEKPLMKQLSLILFSLILITLKGYGQDSSIIEKDGIYVGLNMGTWFPDGNNKVLGNPTIIGFTLDLKPSINSFALNFDLIGWPKGRTTEPIQIKYGDSLLLRNEYFGAQVTIDYCRQVFETKRLVFEVMSGIGFGELTYYNPDKNTHVDKGSFVFNPGISIRYLVGKKVYLQLKTQYCIANYDLKDNVSSDLRGNYLMTKLIIGSR